MVRDETLIQLVTNGAFCCALSVAVLLIVFWAVRRNKVTASAWTTIAQELGLDYREGSLGGSEHQMSGELGGRSVTVETYKVRSRQSASTYTRIVSRFKVPIDGELRMYREGVAAGLNKLVGHTDIKTGDSAFDGRFMLEAKDSERALKVLSAEVRGALLSYDVHYPVEIFPDRLEWSVSGQYADGRGIRACLEAQQRVCEAIEIAQAALNYSTV